MRIIRYVFGDTKYLGMLGGG